MMAEPKFVCDFEGCTFPETRVCATTGSETPCEHAHQVADETLVDIEKRLPSSDADGESLEGGTAAELEDHNQNDSSLSTAEETGAVEAHDMSEGLYSGEELGTEALSQMMTDRPSRLVAVLGEENSGKTCFLVCLYMMVMSGDMEEAGYLFAGSRTLPGFESRALAGRAWPERKPERLSIRTTMQGREAGFMHLDLLEKHNGVRHRLFLSDIPGEWTDAFLDSVENADRLAFAAQSDVIIIMIDGNKLHGKNRHKEVERNRLLIERLDKALEASRVPLLILVSREDELHGTDLPGLAEIEALATAAGFSTSSQRIATYSMNEEIKTAHGVSQVLHNLLETTELKTEEASASQPNRFFGWPPAMQEKSS